MHSPANNAVIDFGRVSASGHEYRRGIVVRQRVGVRLEGGVSAPVSARVSVALAAETFGCTVKVNGITLSLLPRLIDPVHRVGATVTHLIETTIPASVPPGQVLSTLQWFAETD